MKLIVDIDEETYEIIENINYFYNMSRITERIEKQEIVLAIKNGTPLSEELKTIKAETIIDELEKIKAEITEYRRKNNCGVLECLDIIDKEIKGAWQSRWRK